MFWPRWMALCLCTWAVLMSSSVAVAKLCCDQDCMRPISYGRTKDRYITQEIGHLSFPNAAIVTVLAKQETVDSLGREMWLAEIQSRKGLILADFVSELHILCDPKQTVEESFDDVSYVPDHHTEEEIDEALSVSQGAQSDSQIPPIRSENTAFQSTDTPHQTPEHRNTEYEHEQAPEYTADQDSHVTSVNQHLEDTHQQNTLSQEPDLHAHETDADIQHHIISPTPDQQAQSEPVQQHDMYPQEDVRQHEQNIQQENHEHGVPGDLHPELLRANDMLSSEDSIGDGSSTSDEDLLHEENHQWQDDGKNTNELNSISNDESTPVPPSQDDMETDFPSTDHERTTENSASSESTAIPEAAESPLPPAQHTDTEESIGEPMMQSRKDINTHEQPAIPSQDTEYDRHNQDETDPALVTLKNGQSAHVEQLPNGDYQITTQNGSVMDVDYDYIYDLDVELLNALDYDYTGNAPDDEHGRKQGDGDVPEVETEIHTRESLIDEGYPSDDNRDERSHNGRSEEATQPEVNVPGPTGTVDNVGDRHRQHHSYLDVQSLRQRYQHDRGTDATQDLLEDRDYQHMTTEQVHTQQQTDSTHLPTPEPQEWAQRVETHLPTLEPEQLAQNAETHIPTPEPEQLAQHVETHLPTPAPNVDTHIPTPEPEQLAQHVETHLPTPAEPAPNVDNHIPTPESEQLTQNVEAHLPTGEPDQWVEDRHIILPTPDPEPQMQNMDADVPPEPEPEIQFVDADTEAKPTQQVDTRLPTTDREQMTHDDKSSVPTPDVGSYTVLSSHMLSVELITKFLPPSLASWISEHGPELGIVGWAASILTLVVPLCCSCCHYWRDSRRKAMTISKQTASRRALEEQIQKFKSEKNTVHSDLLLLEERYGSLENELELVQQKNHSLTEANADLEENYAHVCGDLSSVQQELIQCNAQVDQLRSELKHQQMQLSAQTSDKEVALQQIALLRDQIEECTQNVQELEATKEQLEEDAFSTHNSLQKLEAMHAQVSQELTDASSENAQLKSQLESSQAEVSTLQQLKVDNEQEILTLNSCLSQLMSSADTTGGGEGDGQGAKEADRTNAERSLKDETLQKIQAMLDTTKVQTKLQAAVEERDKNSAALEEQTALVKELQAENSTLQYNIRTVESQLNECSADFKKLQDKHATLTEYFEQKEHNLHRMLGAEEAVRQAVETREAQVKEKAESLEQTETRHKEELKQLRTEMFEIEKSLMSQVHTCQKRAEEAIAEQRRLEQECKALKLEREDMRKRFSAKSVSPSSGTSTDRQHSLIVRPPSAPYLPRTSSPGAYDSPDNDQITSMLNNTDPLPGSHTRPPVAFPNPSHHLPHDQSFPPIQAPLRHPIPERERPRYPPPAPPPGRRIVRGYPPFDRRHPMPPPRGHYGPVHRFHHDTNAVPERRRPLSNPPPGARSTPPLGMYPPRPSPSSNLPNSSAGFVPVQPAVPESNYQSSNMPNQRSQERTQLGKYPEV